MLLRHRQHRLPHHDSVVENKTDPEVEDLKAQLEGFRLELEKQQQQQQQIIDKQIQAVKSEAIKIAREQLEMEKWVEEEQQRVWER